MTIRILRFGQRELVIPFVEEFSIKPSGLLRIVRYPDVDKMKIIELPAREWHEVTIEK